MPAGRHAVGWRVSVYWVLAKEFHMGVVAGFDAKTGRHNVAYDGEDKAVVSAQQACSFTSPRICDPFFGTVGSLHFCASRGPLAVRMTVRCCVAFFTSCGSHRDKHERGVPVLYSTMSLFCYGTPSITLNFLRAAADFGCCIEQEQLLLAAEKIKWLYPTGNRARGTTAVPPPPLVDPMLDGPRSYRGAIPLGLPTPGRAWDLTVPHPGCVDARVRVWGLNGFSEMPLRTADAHPLLAEVGTRQAAWLRTCASVPAFGTTSTRGQLLGLGPHRPQHSNHVSALCADQVKTEAEEDGLLTHQESKVCLTRRC
jgi:hypothetical protein